MISKTRTLSIANARRTFSQLIGSVFYSKEAVVVTNWNRPQAVIVPYDWYEQAQAALAPREHEPEEREPGAP